MDDQLTATDGLSSNASGLAPVVEDLSIYLVCGRVVTRREPGFTHVASALTDAVEAERLGFRRAWVAERYDLKEAGALLGGIGARTSRIELGTGALAAPSRHPLVAAAFGATMHALYGPRFILGLGRVLGLARGAPPMGFRNFKIPELVDYARTLKGLWAGERVQWHPPGESAPVQLRTTDVLGDVPAPQVWYCTYALPRAARASADEAFDGVMLFPYMTPDAVRGAVQRLRNACADAGRDPEDLRICQPVVVANDLDDVTTRAYAHARAVTYLEWPKYGEDLISMNGWDPSVADRLRNHKLILAQADFNADHSYHRIQLMELASLVPDEWMDQSCAIGSAERCVEQFQAYRDAGADEIAVYASTPAENARLIDAWRTHTSGAPSRGVGP